MRLAICAGVAAAALQLSACETDKPAAEESTGPPAAPAGGCGGEPADTPPLREPCGGGPIILPTEEEQAFAAEIADPLARARYMEQVCSPTEFPAWERLPLTLCEYSRTNSDRTTRSAKVILLDPSPEQLAQWIFSSCRAIGKDNATCRGRLFERVRTQSGGQFPVSGVVLEDILPEDGAYEVYTFRNGVTVELDGVPYRSTAQLGDAEIARALAPDTRIVKSKKYARIVSTSPDDYRANGGTADVGTTANPSLNWPAVAGAAYRAAWGSPNNELMIAWARAHADRL